MIDLDAYFARIGYTGSRDATRATLTAIHRAHVRAIPFENLDVLLGRGIRIDLPSIEQKLVRDRRGGYCFEQNGLLAGVLHGLGFRVTPLVARVRWQVPVEMHTALTHMLLRVETTADGVFLADVGFGSMSLKQPLVFDFEIEQDVAFESRRLIQRPPTDGSFGQNVPLIVHQARIGSGWNDVYQFTPAPASFVDFEMGNWFTSTHPQSRFVQNLVAARTEDAYRCTLLNREFTIRHADGRVDKRLIDSADELLTVLAQHFYLQFPPGTRFGAAGANWPD